MKLRQLKDSLHAIKVLIDAELPIRISFELNNIVNKIDDIITNFEKFRVKLVCKHGEDDNKGNTTVKKEKMEEFTDELNDLLDSDVDITPVSVPISVLEECGVKLSVKDVNALVCTGFIVPDQDK